jgi:hypothetical protein
MTRLSFLLSLLLACSLALAVPALAACGGDDDDDDNDDSGGDDVADDTGGDDAADDDTGDDDSGDDTGDDDAQTGCVEGDFDPYFGVFHAHTSYSDGELTPADAFAYARDVAGLDALVVTDHLEQLYFVNPRDRWGLCHEQADAAYDPGNYLTDCGFEYGSGFILPFFQSTGHNNVFFSADRFPMIQLDFHDFYASLVACPECVGQFNHPADDPTMTWNDWEYFPDVDERMSLYEFNGDGDTWPVYFDALAAGWHVSPMWNQDNHSANWGTANDRRSGFYMTDLTREALHEAMQAGRSFMTLDKNAAIRMMGAQTCWMGSQLKGYPTLPLDVETYDLDAADGFTAIEIYGPGMELLESVDCAGQTTCAASFDFPVTASTYFVARAVQADGDVLVAAPIWVEP